MTRFRSSNLVRLFEEISENMEASRIEELRSYFLRGFIGQKVLDPVPKCPIDSMFWDWLYSYYPDNESSNCRYSLACSFIGDIRFGNFGREYLTFLLDHRRFAHEFLDWIQLNETSLTAAASAPGNHRLSPIDIKLYSDVNKRVIREKLACVLLLFNIYIYVGKGKDDL